MNYTLEADGEAFPTTSEIWIVPLAEYFFLIGVGIRETRKQVEAKRFRKSLIR
jgi:hypothetical protein